MWLVLICITELEDWHPSIRRSVHSLAFVAVGLAVAKILASPTILHLAIVVAVCAVVGFFGEKWTKHL